MNVDLSKNEIELIDEAIKEWQQAPTRDGAMSSIMGTIFRSAMKGGPGEQSEQDIRRDIDAERKECEKQVLFRERKALMIRAKLMQALARGSEHDIEDAATPPQAQATSS